MRNCISKTAAIMFNKDKDMCSKISHPIKWALLLSRKLKLKQSAGGGEGGRIAKDTLYFHPKGKFAKNILTFFLFSSHKREFRRPDIFPF